MEQILSSFGNDFDFGFQLKNNIFKLWLLVTILVGLTRLFALENYDEITEIIRIFLVGGFCLFADLQKKRMANKNLEHLLNSIIILSQIICEIESLQKKVEMGNNNAGAFYMGIFLNTCTYLILNWRLAILIYTLSISYYCLRICETPVENLEFTSQSIFLLSLSVYFLYYKRKQGDLHIKKLLQSESKRIFLEEFIHKYVPNPIIICTSNQFGHFNTDYLNSATFELLKMSEFSLSRSTPGNNNSLDHMIFSEKVKLRENLNALRFERVKEKDLVYTANNFNQENLNPNFQEIFHEISSSRNSGPVFKEYKASFSDNDFNTDKISKNENSKLNHGNEEFGLLLTDPVPAEKEVTGYTKALKKSCNYNPSYSRINRPLEPDSKINHQVVRTFSVKCCSLTLENKNAVLFIFNENQEGVLKNKEKVEKKYFKPKESLIASVSQKLYTPLNIIITSLDNIKEDINSDKVLRKQLKVCKKSSQLLYYSISNVLDIFQPGFNLIDADMKYYKLGPIMEEVVDLTKFLAKIKKIKLTASFQQFKDIRLHCDPESLKRVLLNLLDNSLKYTSLGGTINILLSLRTFEKCSYPTSKRRLPNSKQESYSKLFLQIAVQDNGCGMPRSLQRDLMKSLSNPEFIQGISTGLYSAQKLIKSMLSREHQAIGALKLISLPQIQGSQFSFLIPVESLTENRSSLFLNTISCPWTNCVGSLLPGEFYPETKMPSKEIQELLNSKRVLIVGSDISSRLVLIKYLLKFGINMSETADNGAQAVEKVRDACANLHPYYFVFLDINMPGKGVYQASKEITLLASKGEIEETIIIATTADVTSVNWNYCHEAGIKAFLTKPVNINLLRGTLEAFLGKQFEST